MPRAHANYEFDPDLRSDILEILATYSNINYRHRLPAAMELADRARCRVNEIVAEMREEGMTWDQVAEAAHLNTKQAAQQRWAKAPLTINGRNSVGATGLGDDVWQPPWP